MLFYCSEHMQKRESNICELDTCSFLRFSLPTNTEPRRDRLFLFKSSRFYNVLIMNALSIIENFA